MQIHVIKSPTIGCSQQTEQISCFARILYLPPDSTGFHCVRPFFFLVGFVLRLPAQTSVFSPDVKVCFKTNTGKAWSYATPLQAHMHFVWKMNSDISFFKVFSHIFIPFYSLFLCCLLSQTMSCSEKLLRDEWNMKPEDTSTVTNFPLQQNVKACFTHVALS